ncbi:SPOR domain-containing protein [Formosa sediminum]|uniref:SPOR domain-containing protein n=1 Tax=Formosa sediminum TaxID=2594004 RepID=A0A516GN81_9FLAO|nr:SPOR domain-containing protein [Formosa sediminum]QDO92959.1 SPOR domain-containing protein [Formosa sediminum]
MKLLNIKLIALTGFCVVTLSAVSYGQQGHIELNQDPKIDKLLEVKKEMNKDENATNRFKIQIYSGSRLGAEKELSNYNSAYDNWKATLVYETPNYKIWVGSYRSRLEADRALAEIKDNYPNGFIFQPKPKS